MTRPDPRLVGPRVVVRLAEAGDAPQIVRFYLQNDAHLARYESPKPRAFLTERYWAREAEARRDAFRDDRSCRMFIFDRDGQLTGDPLAVLGAVGLTSIIRGAFHACYLGYSLAESAQGRGLMHESLELVVDFAFRELNLHRVMANHDPENHRSGRVLERLGFTNEGYARRYLFFNGQWVDHVLTSKVNPDWHVPPGQLRRREDGAVEEITG